MARASHTDNTLHWTSRSHLLNALFSLPLSLPLFDVVRKIGTGFLNLTKGLVYMTRLDTGRTLCANTRFECAVLSPHTLRLPLAVGVVGKMGAGVRSLGKGLSEDLGRVARGGEVDLTKSARGAKVNDESL